MKKPNNEKPSVFLLRRIMNAKSTALWKIFLFLDSKPEARSDKDDIVDAKRKINEISKVNLKESEGDLKRRSLDLDSVADKLIGIIINRKIEIPFDYLFTLGSILFSEEKYSISDKYIGMILKKDPENIDALSRHIENLIMEDRVADAEKTYRVLSKLSSQVLFEWLVGSKLDNLQKHETLIAFFDRLISHNPDEINLKMNRACVLVRIGEVEGKIEKIDHAIGFLDSIKDEYQNDILYLLTLAFALLKKGNYQKSLDICNNIIKIDENVPGAYCIMGDVYAAQKKYDDALSAYNNATVLASKCYESCCKIMMKQAGVMEKIGRTESAVENYARVLSFKPCVARDMNYSIIARDKLLEFQKKTPVQVDKKSSKEFKKKYLFCIAVILLPLVLAEAYILLCLFIDLSLASIIISASAGVIGVFLALFFAGSRQEKIKEILGCSFIVIVAFILALILPLVIAFQIAKHNPKEQDDEAIKQNEHRLAIAPSKNENRRQPIE